LKENVFFELNKSSDEKIKVEYTFLKDFVSRHTKYNSVDELIEHYSYEEVENLEIIFNKHEYIEQTYVVHFETGTPVNVSVSVWHSDKTLLTKDEIISEAFSYLEDIKIELNYDDIYEIEVVKIVPGD
jgi:hypothetical protein